MDEPYKYGDKIQVLVNGKWLDGEWLEFNHRYSRHMVKVTMFPGSSITVTDGYPADMIRHAPTTTTFTRGQRIEYLEDSAWLPGVYIEPSHVEGFPHRIKCDSGKILCAAEGSIRDAASIPFVQTNSYPCADRATSQFIVWTSGGDPVCTIDAADWSEAQSILKFQTPGPTFNLKVFDRYLDDDYGSLSLPTHKQWVESKMATIEAQRAEKGIANPTTFKWGQLVIVDGGTDNAREGIVICDQPSQTDRSWFVSTPPCCNQWIRADRLTALEAGKVEAVKLETPKVKTVATQEQGGGPPFKPGDIVRIKPEFYDNFGDQYINFEFEVQPFDDPNCLKISAVQDSEIWQLAMPEWIFKVTPTASPSLGGQTVPLAEHHSVVDLYERQIAKMTDSSQTLSELRSRLHVLSEEANEAARYAHSCPGHTQSTLKTIAFRLDCLARGVTAESDSPESQGKP